MYAFGNCVLEMKQQKDEELHDLYTITHRVFFFHGARSCSRLGPLHYRGCTNTDTSHSVHLLWTSDQPDAQTSL